MKTTTLETAMCLSMMVFSAPVMAHSSGIERYRSSGSAPATILEAVRLPADTEMLVLSGQTAPLADAPDQRVTAATTLAELGDTEAQTDRVFARIEATLRRRGWTMRDVVKLTVYLVGDPAKGGRMDYAGMGRAYARHFGTHANPEIPTRATVQVVALAEPAFLVEIEATAARAGRNTPTTRKANGNIR